MDTMECILKRRSVRRFKPDPVPESALNQILESIKWAPSWANVQPWEVIIVKDAETKGKLSAATSDGNPARKAIAGAPIVMALCAKKGISGFYKGQAVTSLGDWMMFDLGIACQNLCLAAWELGLGTVHAGYLKHEEANKILGVPDGLTVLELIPLGYPDHEPKAPPRKELKDFVFYEKYGQR